MSRRNGRPISSILDEPIADVDEESDDDGDGPLGETRSGTVTDAVSDTDADAGEIELPDDLEGEQLRDRLTQIQERRQAAELQLAEGMSSAPLDARQQQQVASVVRSYVMSAESLLRRTAEIDEIDDYWRARELGDLTVSAPDSAVGVTVPRVADSRVASSTDETTVTALRVTYPSLRSWIDGAQTPQPIKWSVTEQRGRGASSTDILTQYTTLPLDVCETAVRLTSAALADLGLDPAAASAQTGGARWEAGDDPTEW